MEQAHTQLIAQLNERILAADNTPLYIKFAETVKNAVRSGVLEHGNILPGERDLSQLTGVSRITVRKAMQALEEEGVVTRSRGYGTQINNIFEYSLKEARGFSQQVVFFNKTKNMIWIESYFNVIIGAGFLLFPIVLLIVYFDLSPQLAPYFIGFVIIIAKILLFYKCFSNFFNKFHGAFHLILYFCALEILPDFVLWKGIILANNILILNF